MPKVTELVIGEIFRVVFLKREFRFFKTTS